MGEFPTMKEIEEDMADAKSFFGKTFQTPPPEWAMQKAREVFITANDPDDSAFRYMVEQGAFDDRPEVLTTARALAAIEAETAERVERETREADAARLDYLAAGRRAQKGNPDSRVTMMTRDDLQEACAQTLEIGARALRALPAKYGAKT